MKKFNLALILIVVTILSEITVYAQDEKIEKAAIDFSRISPLGMIVPSILPPIQFLRFAGSAWVPADGRHIDKGSFYALLTGTDRVPDLRGMFIRGLNKFDNDKLRNDGNQDPDGENRQAGTYQEDAFKEHSHATAIHHNQPWGAYGGSSKSMVGTREASWPTQKTSAVGKKENRPKNIAVYYYIKVK